MLQPIAPNLYGFTGLNVGRVYLIEDPDGLTLIDTSIASAAPKILRQLAASGRAARDVRRILITHAHPDHVGSLAALKAATGAQVIASAIERPVIEGRAPVPRVPREQLRGLLRWRPPATTYPGTPVDRQVRDGECLREVLGGVEVVFTPGHAPGHIAFWQPARRILFCGDVLFHWPNLRLPPRALTVDMDENKRSIRRLAQLDPALVCFGHGDPLTEDAAASIRAFAARLDG